MNWDPKPDSALEIQAWHGHSWMTGHQKKDGWLLLCELRDLSEPRGQSAKLGSISASPPLRWLSCQLWGYLGCLLNALCCIRTTVTVHPPKFDSIQSAGRLLAAVSMVNHLIYSSSKEYKKNWPVMLKWPKSTSTSKRALPVCIMPTIVHDCHQE